jgi:DNA-binding ferritin-like protein (Dps family)
MKLNPGLTTELAGTDPATFCDEMIATGNDEEIHSAQRRFVNFFTSGS